MPTGFQFRVFFFSETGCHTKAKEPSLPYYLPIAEGRRGENANSLSRVWTLLGEFISLDSNFYYTMLVWQVIKACVGGYEGVKFHSA